MTLRRALAAGLLGLIAAVAGPASWASAAAPTYPPNNVSISISSSLVRAGASVTVSGSGFQANSAVSVTTSGGAQGFTSQPLGFHRAAPDVDRLAAAIVRAGPGGSFSTTVSFGSPGRYTITASGTSAAGTPASASASVQVLPAEAGGIGGAGTGSDTGSGSGASGVGGEGSLPDTGASIGLPVTLGAILLLGGAGLITVVRRRKRSDATV